MSEELYLDGLILSLVGDAATTEDDLEAILTLAVREGAALKNETIEKIRISKAFGDKVEDLWRTLMRTSDGQDWRGGGIGWREKMTRNGPDRRAANTIFQALAEGEENIGDLIEALALDGAHLSCELRAEIAAKAGGEAGVTRALMALKDDWHENRDDLRQINVALMDAGAGQTCIERLSELDAFDLIITAHKRRGNKEAPWKLEERLAILLNGVGHYERRDEYAEIIEKWECEKACEILLAEIVAGEEMKEEWSWSVKNGIDMPEHNVTLRKIQLLTHLAELGWPLSDGLLGRLPAVCVFAGGAVGPYIAERVNTPLEWKLLLQAAKTNPGQPLLGAIESTKEIAVVPAKKTPKSKQSKQGETPKVRTF